MLKNIYTTTRDATLRIDPSRREMMSFRVSWHRAAVKLGTSVTALAIVSLSLVGCGNSAIAQSGSATSGTINWWGWTPDTNVAQRYIRSFNKQYPNIHVTFKMFQDQDYNAGLRPALASSSGPDVFDMSTGGSVGEIQAFGPFAIDLTSTIEKPLGPDWKSKIAPFGYKYLSRDGKLAALPVGSVGAGNLWINETIFNKYGLKAPTTFNEWTTDCKALTSHGQGCFVEGVSGNQELPEDTIRSIADSVKPGYFLQAIQGKAKWTAPAMIKTLTIWQNMKKDGILTPDALGLEQYPDANNGFQSRKYAMIQMGSWYAQYDSMSGAKSAMSAAGVTNPEPFTVVPIPFPDVAGEGNRPTIFGETDYGLAVNSKSSNQRAAKAFVAWVTATKSGQQQVANGLDEVPSMLGIRPDYSKVKLVNPSVQEPLINNMIKEVSSAKETRFTLVSAQQIQALFVALTSTLSGTSPNAAAQTLQSTLN